jgi:hypothetical protein
MTRRRRFLALAVALFALPGAVAAQTGYGADPPIPTGPPLEPPPAETRYPTWLEDGPTVIPAGATTAGSAAVTGQDTAWPVAHSGSACNFDAPAEPSWMMYEPTSIQVLMGAYFSGPLGPPIPSFNYVPLTVRHGWNLGNPFGRIGPGNWEFLADVTGAAITSSYGNWFAGSSLYLRYNWADPGSPLIPYLQGGAGAVVNDAYRDRAQRAVGQEVEFYLHAELGLKCMIAPNLSLDLEGGLQHISNGGIASRNYGVNAFGGSVGFTYYFPWGAP